MTDTQTETMTVEELDDFRSCFTLTGKLDRIWEKIDVAARNWLVLQANTKQETCYECGEPLQIICPKCSPPNASKDVACKHPRVPTTRVSRTATCPDCGTILDALAPQETEPSGEREDACKLVSRDAWLYDWCSTHMQWHHICTGSPAPEPSPAPGEGVDVEGLIEQLKGPVKQAAQRLVNGSFRRDGQRLSDEDRPRFAIPARPDHDDDLVVTDAILEASTALQKLRDERDELVRRDRQWAQSRDFFAQQYIELTAQVSRLRDERDALKVDYARVAGQATTACREREEANSKVSRLKEQVVSLREGLKPFVASASHTRVFLTSRETMHKDGVALYDSEVEAARSLLSDTEQETG